jgi:uncharacterized integral membrane protein
MAESAEGQGRAKKTRTPRSVKVTRSRLLVGLVALVLAIIFIVENN